MSPRLTRMGSNLTLTHARQETRCGSHSWKRGWRRHTRGPEAEAAGDQFQGLSSASSSGILDTSSLSVNICVYLLTFSALSLMRSSTFWYIQIHLFSPFLVVFLLWVQRHLWCHQAPMTSPCSSVHASTIEPRILLIFPSDTQNVTETTFGDAG